MIGIYKIPNFGSISKWAASKKNPKKIHFSSKNWLKIHEKNIFFMCIYILAIFELIYYTCVCYRSSYICVYIFVYVTGIIVNVMYYGGSMLN